MQALPMNTYFRHYESAGVTGDVYIWRDVPSRYLAYQRNVLVWLPPGYGDEPARRYPVLYLHDGQNTFDATTAFAGVDWDVDSTAARLMAAGEIEAAIMVAIYNSPARLQEYDPLTRGPDYIRFIVEELRPAIEATFRTQGGRHNALMGSSMGGLISLAALWWYPQHFYGAACLSPSFWMLYRVGGVLPWLTQQGKPTQPSWLYCDHGTLGYEGRMEPLVRSVLDYARRVGFAKARLRYAVAPKAGHDEASWRRRVADPLRFLLEPGRGRA